MKPFFIYIWFKPFLPHTGILMDVNTNEKKCRCFRLALIKTIQTGKSTIAAKVIFLKHGL